MGWVHSVGIPNVRRSTSEETNRVCVTLTGTHLFFPFYPSFSPTFSTLAIPFFFFFFLPFTPSLYPHPLFSFIILCPPPNVLNVQLLIGQTWQLALECRSCERAKQERTFIPSGKKINAKDTLKRERYKTSIHIY